MFITFEGIDGCGKSTQLERFHAKLGQEGVPLAVTMEPGGTKIGTAIRDILLDVRNNEMVPLAELFLYEADRAQHISEVIKPALNAGKWVICDRFFDATTVYQGVHLGYDSELIAQLNREAASGLTPDITFLLDCPVEVALKRIEKRDRSEKKMDRFEKAALDFHRKIRDGYLDLAKRHKDRFTIIDATLSEDRVARKIEEIISPYLPCKG